MPSLLIIPPDVPQESLLVTPSQTFLENLSLRNSFAGRGYLYSKVSTASTSLEIEFDLGTGNSRTVDHFIVGGCKSLIADGVTEVKLQGSSDAVSWVDQLGTSSSFLSKTFNGQEEDDIIFTASYNDDLSGTLAAYRYFKVRMSVPSGTADFAFRKLYFGASFDMGKEPSTYDMQVETARDSDTWIYPRGHVVMSKAFYPKHVITLEYDGITDTVAQSIVNTLLNNPFTNTIYLYTQTYTDPLYDNVLMHCRLVSDSCSITKPNDVDNWNDIVLVFEEL